MYESTLCILIFASFFSTCTGESLTVCTGSEKQTVHLQCPFGTGIKVKESVYGHNKWLECWYRVGDCTQNEAKSYDCCGRTNCDVTVSRIYSIECMKYVTFFRVSYDCVDVDEIECPNFEREKDEEEDVEIRPDIIFPAIPTKFQHGRHTHNELIPANLGDTKKMTNSGISSGSSDLLQKSATKEPTEDNLVTIIGSACAVAFLLVCIIAVIFLLRKFKWQGEKECVLQLFVGWCKRHPPDGCENPDIERTANDVQIPRSTATASGIDVTRQNLENHISDRRQVNVEIKTDSSDNKTFKDVNSNNDRQNEQSNEICRTHRNTEPSQQNHYTDFETLAGEKYCNPMLRNVTSRRVILDQKAYNTTPIVCEGPGITAV